MCISYFSEISRNVHAECNYHEVIHRGTPENSRIAVVVTMNHGILES